MAHDIAAKVWLVSWLRDHGEAVIHAARDRDGAIGWVIAHFNELYDGDDHRNMALIFALPLDQSWDGVHDGARTVSLRDNALVVVDFDAGTILEKVDRPAAGPPSP